MTGEILRDHIQTVARADMVDIQVAVSTKFLLPNALPVRLDYRGRRWIRSSLAAVWVCQMSGYAGSSLPEALIASLSIHQLEWGRPSRNRKSADMVLRFAYPSQQSPMQVFDSGF